MKTTHLLLFLLLTSSATAQTQTPITIGVIDSLYSRILKEPRSIWVHVPDADGRGIFAPQRYPVLYLLDGDAHFASVVGIIQQMSGAGLLPRMIVVGIPNTDRTRDLTPTHIENDLPMMGTAFSRTTGGGENFLSFIEKELMPHIDSLYPTQPYRVLVGHSFGGLTVMQCLTQHTKLFNAYVAIDPSMWYDKERFLEKTKKALTEKRYDDVTLYLSYANTMEPGMGLRQAQDDTTADTRHIRSIMDLEKFLKRNKGNGLRFDSKYYAYDDHGSVPLITEYDGLRFIFDYYRLKLSRKEMEDSTTALVDKMEKHYRMVSKRFGYAVKPPENTVNNLGYQALGDEQFEKAQRFFKWNVDNYPESANVYDSYGDYFVAKGDTANAIVQFKKALAVRETPDTRQKLEALVGKK
jgi:hypothetical protein